MSFLKGKSRRTFVVTNLKMSYMEIGLIISSILLIAFAILAVIDGFYLHIVKYQLYNHSESKLEHLTHTIRAVLFPAIVYFLFIKQNSEVSFYMGASLVLIDIVVLLIDAFIEKDSRAFMGGLPRWEYILHLLVNGFHFSSIAVFLAIKLRLTNNGLEILPDLAVYKYFEPFKLIAQNLIPGAVLIAAIHLVTSVEFTVVYWNNVRRKLICC
jgi:hypothetical protein